MSSWSGCVKCGMYPAVGQCKECRRCCLCCKCLQEKVVTKDDEIERLIKK